MMNNKIRILSTTTALFTALMSSASTACLDEKQERHEIRSFIFSNDGNNHASSIGKTISITDVNGEMTVVIDGKEIPSDRIIREGGKIKILDSNGNEVPLWGVTIDAGNAGKGMFFGLKDQLGEGHDADTMIQWFGGEMNPPKVMMGTHLSQPSKALEYHLGLDAGATTLIAGIVDGLGADEAGIARYDIIVAINGKKPANPQSIQKALADKEPGDEITFSIIHQGKKRKANVQLSEYKVNKFGTFRIQDNIENLPFGDNGFFEFRIDGNLENLHEILVDPDSGNFFRKLPGDREFHFEFNDELLEKLGEDFGGDIKLRLRKHLSGQDNNQETRSDEINEHIKRLQKILDDLVKQAKSLEKDGSDI